MSRSYKVIDADGHILEPFTLWGEYLDPKYRERAPKLIKDEKGIQLGIGAWVAALVD